jgi:hypothetical protein
MAPDFNGNRKKRYAAIRGLPEEKSEQRLLNAGSRRTCDNGLLRCGGGWETQTRRA